MVKFTEIVSAIKDTLYPDMVMKYNEVIEKYKFIFGINEVDARALAESVGHVNESATAAAESALGASNSATVAAESALGASNSATVAAESALGASNSATSSTGSALIATNAKTAAEAARDAALIQAGVHVDEPTGRAAVADGVAFKVQGSGDIAAYEYRRVNATTSLLIATYPSESSITAIKSRVLNLEPEANTFETLDPTYNDPNSVLIIDLDKKILVQLPDPRVKKMAENSLSQDFYETLDNNLNYVNIIDPNNNVIFKLMSENGVDTKISKVLSRVDKGLTQNGDLIGPFMNRHMMRKSKMVIAQIKSGLNAQYVLTLIGDSYTQGPQYSERFAKQLQDLYGIAGLGWFGFGWCTNETKVFSPAIQPACLDGCARNDLVTTKQYIGTWTSIYRDPTRDAPSLSTVSTNEVGAYIRISYTEGHNGATLFYAGDGTGVIAISWDDGVTESTIALSSIGINNVNLTGIPLTAGLLKIRVVSGFVMLAGVDFKSSNSGFRINKLGSSGATANQFSQVSSAWADQILKLGGDGHIIMLGTNDQAYAYTPDQFLTSIGTILTSVKSKFPANDFLIAMPAENQRTSNVVAMPVYAEKIREYAWSQDVSFIDFQYLFGSPANFAYAYANANPLRPWYKTDLVHPEPDTGGQILVSGFINVLISN